MTEERLVLADLLEKAGDGDFPRAVAEAVLQLLVVVRPHVFAGVFGEVAGKHHQNRFGSLLLRVFAPALPDQIHARRSLCEEFPRHLAGLRQRDDGGATDRHRHLAAANASLDAVNLPGLLTRLRCGDAKLHSWQRAETAPAPRTTVQSPLR